MKKILIIVPKLSGGGAEKTAVNLAEILTKKYDVSLVTFFDDIKYKTNIPIINMKISPKKSVLGKIINTLIKINRMKKIKKNEKPDYSISFMRSSSIINVFSRKNDKIIVSMRNKMSSADDNYIKKILTKKVCKKADIVVSLSKMVKEDLIKIYKIDEKKIFVIYNPCDYKKINNLCKETIPIEISKRLVDKKVLINVGRISKQKGQWHLVNVMKKLKNNDNYILLILGIGEDEQKLKEYIKENNMDDKIILLGFDSNPYKYINCADLFIFTSLFEGLGNVLLETMAVGTPIISTDCDYGPREILEPDLDLHEEIKNIRFCKYGVLVPKFGNSYYESDKDILQEEQICSAIEILSNDNNYMYFKKSKDRIKSFSPDKILKEWEKLFF